MTETRVPGFELKLHGSLCEPITIGGAPRSVAILNGTFAAIAGFGLQAPAVGIPVFIAIHALACFATARDPHFFTALGRHTRLHPRLDG